ncbi:hypothetical protein AEP_00673 [Curvibacter sp. AEP1-3]|uniref:hypothetical protein n=1 Tax=Curvibacter sp. AEP1-3 TaxID=1844971 RepID=UPI000B5628CF|nr:hypothetical protein [Curvibacter sp. AEP1-3]ARV17633.1 hypothetical protein AEP_00673 [Curvibacter sp. AEP1-3]
MNTPSPTLNDLGSKIFRNLFSCFEEQNPNKSLENFRDEIWHGLVGKQGVSGYDVYEELFRTQVNNAAAPIIISVAYCAEARQHQSASRLDHAWAAMAEANYWCGVAMAGVGIKSASEKTIIATKKNTAAKGGETRRESYEPIVEEARRLAREMRPSRAGWKSRSQAGREIRQAVESFAVKKGIRLSENQALKTIDGWLREMPDAGELFPQKQVSN